jgi:predicted amidohydrolase YtcJ
MMTLNWKTVAAGLGLAGIGVYPCWPHKDMEGRTVLPGFIDSHEHLMLTGSQETAVHLNDAADIDAILQRMADRTGRTDKGEWVYGSYLNEQNLTEKAMPTRQDLDRAVPDHAVFIMHATCHMCSLNTRALEILQPPADLEGLDCRSGSPTGVVRDPGILTHVHPTEAPLVRSPPTTRLPGFGPPSTTPTGPSA